MELPAPPPEPTFVCSIRTFPAAMTLHMSTCFLVFATPWQSMEPRANAKSLGRAGPVQEHRDDASPPLSGLHWVPVPEIRLEAEAPLPTYPWCKRFGLLDATGILRLKTVERQHRLMKQRLAEWHRAIEVSKRPVISGTRMRRRTCDLGRQVGP